MVDFLRLTENRSHNAARGFIEQTATAKGASFIVFRRGDSRIARFEWDTHRCSHKVHGIPAPATPQNR